MGRFVGLSKNRGSGLPIEDPSIDNSGLILTSNGTGFVLAGGAEIVDGSAPEFVNANETLNTQLSVESAFSNSVFTFAWRNGAQFGLSLSSSGVISGAASGLDVNSTLQILITDTKYNVDYEVDIDVLKNLSNTYPTITTSTSNQITLTSSGTFQFTNSGTATEWVIVNRGSLPADASLSSSGLLTFASFTPSTTVTYNFVLGVRNGDLPAGQYRLASFNVPVKFPDPLGQQQYEGAYGQPGGQCTFSWVAPAGVTSVNVMAMGAGGGGCQCWANCGGHGGGMVWANNIPVTPGQSYTVQVGRGGCWCGGEGGCSCWPGMIACGGCCGCYGGCFSFPGSVAPSGSCCGGYGMVAFPDTGGGGGGGAGYCSAMPANSCSGGLCGCGGGGGTATSHHSSTWGTGGGGGTGSCGMCCYTASPVSCGCCGNAGYSHQTGSGGQGGSGGTCGNPGEPWSNGQSCGYSCGGRFGGGGGGGGTSGTGGWGGPGVVRIIWGTGRCWPCTNTHNL